jgi:hypothetical protein
MNSNGNSVTYSATTATVGLMGRMRPTQSGSVICYLVLVLYIILPFNAVTVTEIGRTPKKSGTNAGLFVFLSSK